MEPMGLEGTIKYLYLLERGSLEMDAYISVLVTEQNTKYSSWGSTKYNKYPSVALKSAVLQPPPILFPPGFFRPLAKWTKSDHVNPDIGLQW